MEDKIIICDCSSAEHQMVLRFDDDKDLGRMVYVEIHLVPLVWYKRLWMGLKYIFGYKCCYGNFEEMILSPKHARQIRNLYEYLNQPNVAAKNALKERLAEFAKKAAKEAHDDEDIQKLAEGLIWVGADWMAAACDIRGIKDSTNKKE